LKISPSTNESENSALKKEKRRHIVGMNYKIYNPLLVPSFFVGGKSGFSPGEPSQGLYK